MVDIVEQLCIKSWSVEAENGDQWKAVQGKTYTTSVPKEGDPTIVVFSNFWVRAPKDHFVRCEGGE